MPEQDTLVSKNQFLLRYEQGFACHETTIVIIIRPARYLPLVSPTELTVIVQAYTCPLARANTAILPVSLYPLIS